MILAGDVGGTKTLLALFEPAERRPTPVALHTYVTNDHESFADILAAAKAYGYSVEMLRGEADVKDWLLEPT